ncbi:glycoside hydrolase family 7 protein [Pleurotus ostreatus PC15]|uniref:Glucanase n=1 Tax=Pleurotus ostreatus (strain PC15) TaxID=1137138 RepID=A0A067NTL1_PLEO1|nr:glycoside hydrolase family 7 protein [Pleurotus ostreatus PC15]
MFRTAALTPFTFAAVVLGQQVGSLTAENHPAISIQQCTASGCTTQQKSVVLDSKWRWTHSTSSPTNCYTGNAWDPALCPDPTTCATNCAVDGGDYSGTYGITTSGNAFTLRFTTPTTNFEATAYTPHVCRDPGLYCCSGNDCGDGNNRYGGVCDKDGCDLNSYCMDGKNFLGRGKTVATTKKVTVVLQFITDNNTPIVEICRIYVQNGCPIEKMGDAMANGMVLIMSLWSDHAAHMLWLDSDYPLDKSPSEPGVSRGACAPSTGNPDDVVSNNANASVTFSNIKYGAIGSTYGGSTPPVSPSGSSSAPPVTSTSTSTSVPTGPTPPAGTVPKWGQCGGINYSGPTTCVAGSTCTYSNAWYSQCL